MNVEKTYTASDAINCWQDIDFKIAEKCIKKLQMRIAKAQQMYDIRKVDILQHRLIHSFYAKSLAVKIVTTNHGKYTPGVDSILWLSPEDKYQAILDLNRRGYKPLPLRRVYILKSDGRKRPLSIPTLRDRAMQTLYKLALEPIAEITADENSYGFRTGRCTRDAISRYIHILSEYPRCSWILEADIQSCFDKINHTWIMKHIPMDKRILWKFLKSGYIENRKLNPTMRGIPQGGSISTVICNMVLDGLEKELIPLNVYYIRYADDFIVMGENGELLDKQIRPLVEVFLNKRGLTLSPKKTLITNVYDGFDFLGWNIRKDNSQLLISPSKKNLNSILHKITNIANCVPHMTFEQMCDLLKPIISGWLNYHRDIVSPDSLDNAINEIISCLSKLTGKEIL